MSEQNKRIGVLGTPGSGKTTLAKYLYYGKLPNPEDVSPTRNNYNLFDEEEYNKGLCKGLNELHDKFNIVTIYDSKSHQFSKDYIAEIEILEECDVIIYVANATKCFKNSETVESRRYLKNIKKELKFYSEYFENNAKKGNNKIFLLFFNDFETEIVSDEHKKMFEEFSNSFGKFFSKKFNKYVYHLNVLSTEMGKYGFSESERIIEWIYRDMNESFNNLSTIELSKENQYDKFRKNMAEKIKLIIKKRLHGKYDCNIVPKILSEDIDKAKNSYVNLSENEEIICLWRLWGYEPGSPQDQICLTDQCIYWMTKNDKFFNKTSKGMGFYGSIKQTEIVQQTDNDYTLLIHRKETFSSIDYITHDMAKALKEVLDEIVEEYNNVINDILGGK